jgi:hypothetical protein
MTNNTLLYVRLRFSSCLFHVYHLRLRLSAWHPGVCLPPKFTPAIQVNARRLGVGVIVLAMRL